MLQVFVYEMSSLINYEYETNKYNTINDVSITNRERIQDARLLHEDAGGDDNHEKQCN